MYLLFPCYMPYSCSSSVPLLPLNALGIKYYNILVSSLDNSTGQGSNNIKLLQFQFNAIELTPKWALLASQYLLQNRKGGGIVNRAILPRYLWKCASSSPSCRPLDLIGLELKNEHLLLEYMVGCWISVCIWGALLISALLDNRMCSLCSISVRIGRLNLAFSGRYLGWYVSGVDCL